MEISMHHESKGKETSRLFSCAVVITASQAHWRIDKQTLRGCNIRRVELATEYTDAVSIAAETGADIIICDDRTTGESPLSLVERLHAHPDCTHIPIIMTGTDASEGSILDAIAAGCSGFLLRPYSLDALLRQLENAYKGNSAEITHRAAITRAAQQTKKGELDKAIDKLDHFVQKADSAEDFYKQGCRSLATRDWNGAIVNFRKAVVINRLYAEAYEGLGRAWKAKGNQSQARKYMHLAAETYSRIGKYQEARNIFVNVLKKNPDSENPFIDLGFAMVKRQDWAGAGRAYAHALEHNADNAAVYAQISRACHFTSSPEVAARHVASALARETGAASSAGVMKKILGESRIPRPRPTEGGTVTAPSFLPTPLADAWLVFRYTCKAFNADKKTPLRVKRMPLEFS